MFRNSICVHFEFQHTKLTLALRANQRNIQKNVKTMRAILQIEYAAAKEFPFHENVFERAWRAWNDFYFRFLNCFENASDEVTSQRKVYFLLWNVHQSGKYHLTKVKCPNEKPQLLRRDDVSKHRNELLPHSVKLETFALDVKQIAMAKNKINNKVQTKSFMTWRTI